MCTRSVDLVYTCTKTTFTNNNTADRVIHVAVLEGYFASLTALGLPIPLSLKLQQSDLKLERPVWTAKSTRTGFSVSLFWPVNSAIELRRSEEGETRGKLRPLLTLTVM